MEIIKKIVYWLPSILIALIIFYFSSKTGSQSNQQSDPFVEIIASWLNISQDNYIIHIIRFVRKTGHIIEYALLGYSVSFAFTNTVTEVSKIVSSLSIFLICYLYAASDEIHQLFVPERSGTIVDTLIDSIGIIIGMFVFFIIRKIYIKFKQRNVC